MSEPPKPPDVPGVVFDVKIGDGGIADVWRGTWDDGSGPQTVAIKVLRDAGRPNLRRRFLREGRILQRQNHPGLVRCLANIDGPQPALILQLLTGESLDKRLAAGPLTIPQVYSLASRLLKILVHLHDQGVVHRDLKASNTWLTAIDAGDGDGEGTVDIVLMDLGLAIDPADPLTSTLGEVLGTHAYMAPEQIAGAKVDVRADLYSLGITLYEALCGQRPYHARGLAGYLQAHRSGRAAPIGQRVPALDPDFALFVDRLLARDPADRPQSAAIALAQLIRCGAVGAAGAVTVRTLAAPRANIGREGVRGAVLALLDGGADGTGGVVQLVGELGSGLAAAAEQARTLAESAGIEHVTIKARPGATADWANAQLARCLDGWAGTVKPTDSSVRGALAGLAGESRAARRVMVVFEDVADDALFGWLGALRAALPEVSLVVTGPAPSRRLDGSVVELRPLTRGETSELVLALLGTRAEPIGLASAVFAATGGQPAFVVATIRRLAAAGALSCAGTEDDGSPAWQWNPEIRPAPAGRATRDLRRALAQLSEGARVLLTAIAEHADPVDLDQVEAETGVDPTAVYTLIRFGLVSIDADDRVALQRPILADVLRPPRPAPGSAPSGTDALRRAWEDLPRLGWAATRAVVDRFREPEPGAQASAVALLDLESLLTWGRPVPQRLVESLREAGDHFAADRSWVLANLALRSGDAPAARRRLQRVLERRDVEPESRTAVDAALAMVDLELRLGRRSDAAIRARGLLGDTALPAEARGRLHLRLAQQHARHLSLHAACESLALARPLLTPVGEQLAELTWVDILVRAGCWDDAEAKLATLARSSGEENPWPLRVAHVILVARLHLLRLDPAAAHAAHVRGEEAAARAGDAPVRDYHAGMAAALAGDLMRATHQSTLLASPLSAELRTELLTVCARRARDARLYQLAETGARECGDRSLLLGLLHSLRGPGARSEAADLVSTTLKDIYSPLREGFLELPEVQWARSLSG